MPTFSNIVAITNSGSADAESTASSMAINPNATITKISVMDLTLGHTYAVRIDFPGISAPQKYVVPSNGAAATNGGKLVYGGFPIDVRIPVPNGLSSVNVSTWADTASATVEVGLVWELGNSNQKTFSDFTNTTNAGTAETKIGTININGGANIKQIVMASRLSVGLIKSIRLDYAGIQTPQKYSCGNIVYDAVGTEVQNVALFPTVPIDVDIKLPANVATVDIYATSQTASNTIAIGLVWI